MVSSNEKKVLLIGHLGFKKNLFDGQTGKTRNVLELLQLNAEYLKSLDYFDTQEFRQSKLSFFKLIKKIFRSNVLVYLPERNNLKYLFPFIYIVSKIKGIDILYLVVGGWLDKFLQSKYLYIAMLSDIKGIFTESNQLTKNLETRYHYKNVQTIPNFRIHSFSPCFTQNNDTLKIVYMARIFREKGIDTVFRLAHNIQNKYRNNHKIAIDFFGPVQKDVENYFKEEIQKYSFVSYKGILEPDQIHKTLGKYDVLVLPSRYSEEGFPGTIMDAYISGIPVIISRWRFLPEYVDDGYSGFIYDLDRETEFYHYVDYLYNDKSQLLKMKHCAHEKSKEYSSEVAWQLMKIYLC